MNKSLEEIQEKLEELKTRSEAIDNEVDSYRLKIVCLESSQWEVLREMENLSKLLEEDEDVALLDLVKQENIESDNFKSSFTLESYREFDDPAGWMVEIAFTTATDAYNFLNSAMFERLFENGYAEKYRVVRTCDNKIVYFKESEHADD